MCLEHVINRSEVADRGYKISGKRLQQATSSKFSTSGLAGLGLFLKYTCFKLYLCAWSKTSNIEQVEQVP